MNMRVLWVVLALWLTGWGAAQTNPLYGQVSCQVNQTAAPAMTGSSSFDMLTFAPDAQCWFNNTVSTLANAGVFHAADGLALAVMMVLFVTTVLIPFVTDPKSRGAKMILSAITFVVFGSITMSAARNEPGNAIDVIRGYMFQGWTDIYIPSANMGSRLISGDDSTGSVSANLQGIASKLAQLNYDSTIYDRKSRQIMDIAVAARSSGASAAATAAEVNQLVTDDQNNYNRNQSTATPGSWTNIGFFLLLGVFAVFAAIVYSTGFGVIIASLMLGIAFAFAAAGNFSGLKTVLNTTLAAFISTLVVPFTVSVVVAIAFGQPTAALNRTLTSDTVAIHAKMQQFETQYQNNYQDCGTIDVTCNASNMLTGIGTSITASWESLRTAFVGMLTILVGMIVSLGIGLSQLRRVPALIGSMLGVSGGGESSGTGANPLGTIAEAIGVAAAVKSLGKKAVQTGARGGKTTEKSDKPGSGNDGTQEASAGAESGGGPSGGGSGAGGSAGGGGGSTGSTAGALPRATPPASAAKSGGNPMTASQKAGAFVASVPTAAGLARNAVNSVKSSANTVSSKVSGAVSAAKAAPGAAVAGAKDAAASVATAVTGARTDIAMGAAARTQRENAARAGTGSANGKSTGAGGTSPAGNADASKTIDTTGYSSPKATSGGAASTGAGNATGKSAPQTTSAQTVSSNGKSTGAGSTSPTGKGDASKTIDTTGYVNPMSASDGTATSRTGNKDGKSAPQAISAQTIPQAPNDVVERPKASPASGAKPAAPAAPAAPPAAPATPTPSGPGNTGGYGSPQNRPAPAPAAPAVPPSVPMVNAVGPNVASSAPAQPQPTRVMTNPGGGMTKTTAGADKGVPGSTNVGPSGSSGVISGKSDVTPATAVTAQNAYSTPKNTTGPAQSGPVSNAGAWKTAQSPASPAPTQSISAPAGSAPTSGTPASPRVAPSAPPSGPGSLPPEPDFQPTPPRPTTTQPRFSPRMDARRKAP